MVTLQCASAAARDGKRHLAIGELHLEVIVLRLFSRSTKRVEEMDDISPVDVVRSRMGKELRERAEMLVGHECSCLLCGEAPLTEVARRQIESRIDSDRRIRITHFPR